ncbi:MAG: hypothetical protein ACI35O_03935 [Bacillaceae bacterium]
MNKNWCVECWGDTGQTELFFTKKEAMQYFKSIRKGLDKLKYTFTKDTITNIADPDDYIIITNLNEL